MTVFWYVVIFSLAGGVVSLAGGALLLGSKKIADKLAAYATPFAAGALLAAVFMDILLEGVEEANPGQLFTWTMAGVVLFYLAERFLRWFHHHHSDAETADEATGHHASAPLIVVGDTVHNALDGVVIAAAFLVSIPTGIVTAIVVALHEIPQEVGDFGLLLGKGYSRRKVLFVNVLSALATLAAAVVTYFIGSEEALPMGVLLGLSAGFLLYIALSDIIPELHRHGHKDRKLFGWQPILLILGAVLVTLTIQSAHNFMPDDGHGQRSKTPITQRAE